MRITTQMLNESARKSGLSINYTSLLNYINGDETNNSLLEALNKNRTTVNTEGRMKYEKLQQEADKLTQSTQIMLQEDEKNLFKQAKESSDNQKIYDSIETLFENYNSTMTALKNASGTMNEFYRQMLTEATEEVKESLEDIGIIFKKNGTASVDMEKVKAADLETLENVFGSESNFMSKINFISTRISDNAEANIESLRSSYSSAGNLYTASISSKYDFWG